MPKYPEIEVQLTGEDGNAMSIVANVAKAMRRALDEEDERIVTADEIAEFRREALSGDYDHVLQTVMAWVEVH